MQAMELSGEGAFCAPRISILGDSISTFAGCIAEGNRVYYQPPQTHLTGVESLSQTWWMRVIEGVGGRLCANASYSGSMVQGNGFPAAEQPGRAEQLLESNGKAPDAVLVFMGVNDYGWGSPEAQEAGRSEAAPAVVAVRAASASAHDDTFSATVATAKNNEGNGPASVGGTTAVEVGAAGDGEHTEGALPEAFSMLPPAVPGAAPTEAAERFGAAYERMLRRVQEAAPGAEIWCVTIPPGREHGKTGPAFAYALRGVTLDAYNQAINDAAAATGARVADVAALGFDYDAYDGTHPTALGMEQLASMVLNAIAWESEMAPSLLGSALASRPLPPLPPDEMRSARRCKKPTCIGCPHARSTGNPWFCICDK